MSTLKEQEERNRNERFSLMKQWLFTKLQVSQTNMSDVHLNGRQHPKQDLMKEVQRTGLPKIVISRDSNRSINTLNSPSPNLKRPRPLVKTWANYNESSKEAPMTVPHYCSKTFWNSPQIVRRRLGPESMSLPCSPIDHAIDNKEREVDSKEDCIDTKPSQTMYIPMYDMLNHIPSTPSRSVLDSPSLCGFCGRKKFSGSYELVGFEDVNYTSCDESCLNSAVNSTVNSPRNSPRLKQKQDGHLGLRRTSSCHTSQETETKLFNKTNRLTKATSNIDFQKRSISKSKKTKIFRSSARSTISLTRPWSINLETFRIVKNESLKTNSHAKYDRKMSLNDNELRRGTERRRSSLIRLFCGENTDTDKEYHEDSVSLENGGTESTSDIQDYSPKVTRVPAFVYGDAIEGFMSILDPDHEQVPSDFGQLKVMFQFYNDKKEFAITLLKGTNVASNIIGNLGMYAKMCLMPGKKQSQTGSDKHDTSDPVFYETFAFRMTLGELLDREMRIKLYNKPGILSTSVPVSECYISLYHYDLTAVTVIWQNLQACRAHPNGAMSQQQRRRGLRHFLCGL